MEIYVFATWKKAPMFMPKQPTEGEREKRNNCLSCCSLKSVKASNMLANAILLLSVHVIRVR